MELKERVPKILRNIGLLGYWVSFGGAAILGLVDIITNTVDISSIMLCLVAAIFFKISE